MNLEKSDTIDYMLENACKNNYLEYIDILVNLGGDANIVLKSGCIKGNLKMVKYSEKNGAKIDGSHLVLASEFGNLKVVKYIVSKGVDITYKNNLSLKLASRIGYLDIVKYLMKKYLDNLKVTKESLINIDLINYIIDSDYNYEIEDILEYLITMNNDLAKEEKVFEYAVKSYNLKLFQLLVSYGVNPSKRNNYAMRYITSYKMLHQNSIYFIYYLVSKGINAELFYFRYINNDIMQRKLKNYLRNRRLFKKCLEELVGHPKTEKIRNENSDAFKNFSSDQISKFINE